jgi:preprotein translocase subunit SecG
MTTVLLVIHLLIAAALVVVVLLQRSEGGALGMGGGPGGMMTGRGAASVLTRLTIGLGAAFFGSSILLAVVFGIDSQGQSVFDNLEQETNELLAPAPDEAELPDEPAVPIDD